MSVAFEVRAVSARYGTAAQPALTDLSVTMEHGSFGAIIGPNGSGKSTLIRVLLGALQPMAGSVLYQGRSIADWPRRELARAVAAVAQLEEMPFPLRVRELVAMGRYPHLGAWRTERPADHAAIERALERCDVRALADRAVTSLSGGERQRARIARALAQEPNTLVLDEPTAALDIAHEMAIFELLRSLTRSDGATVIVATHHLNLAARYADTLLLLQGGRRAAFGAPAEVLQQSALQDVYAWPLFVHAHEGSGFDHGAPQVVPLAHNQHGLKP